ncbi:MAG: WYL domain-containing protein [Ruminococcus sp.]|nr:WYL domain-containing protein [Ruminococcus sp.]
MAKNPRQKQKLLYLRKILLEKTDENHGLTVNELISELDAYGIVAERKSIYDDLHILENFGLDIYSEKSRTVKYYIGEREFQISELKLLVDAIQSSKFITEKKSYELIKKIESLASENDAKLLQNQVIISNRVKTSNETIYYNVDRLHDAISNNRSVTFYYNEWKLNLGSAEKIKLVRKHDGALYRVSPWALCWDDENYYLIAFDENSGSVRHYRVDKIEKITVTDNERQGREVVEKISIADYAKSTFSMFAGDTQEITLSVDKGLVGVIADRFGKNIFITSDENNDNNFIVKVNVNISDQFFGWVYALGDRIRITAPESVCARFRAHLDKVAELYEKEAKV